MLQKQTHPLVINGIAANAAEESRTYERSVLCAESLGFAIRVTQSAGTAINATLYKSADGGSNYARIPSVETIEGTGTCSDYTATKAITGSDTLWLDLDVQNCTHVKIVVSVTAGGASDLIYLDECEGTL